MSEQTLITSMHPKGVRATALFHAKYNKAKLDEDQAQRLNESPEFWSGIESLIEKCSVDKQEAESKSLRADWEKFYRDELGLAIDFSSVIVPNNPGEFERVIMVAQGVTIKMVLDACRKYFGVWTYTDNLDAAIDKNERTPVGGSYVIRVRERIEADEELKNLSANDIKSRNLTTMTLLERLIHELKYFKETGKHLDIKNWTLAAGSRDAGGGVPSGRWDSDGRRLVVDWYYPQDAYGYLRARAVVS